MTPSATSSIPRRRATLAEPRPPRARRGPELAETRLFDPQGPSGPRSEPTLEDTVLAALRGLHEAGRAACPVCSGSLQSAGSCRSCGSALS